MKNILYTLLVSIIALVGCQNSQENGSRDGRNGNFNPEQFIERQISRMEEELDLSNTQKEEITDLFKDISTKQIELRKSGKERSEMRTEMTELNEEREVKIKEILDDDQYVKWEKMKEEFAARRRPRGNQ